MTPAAFRSRSNRQNKMTDELLCGAVWCCAELHPGLGTNETQRSGPGLQSQKGKIPVFLSTYY